MTVTNTSMTQTGFSYEKLATPSTGTAELAVWRVEITAGAEGVVHSLDKEKVCMVLAGELTLTTDQHTVVLSAGDVYTLPAGTPVQARNDGFQPVEVVAVAQAGVQATAAGHSTRPEWTL
ncbi:cupin domain-containing protein [Streptomyces sp. TRM 70351]|uniref:cupin domain-containing protein n=1 Tax=Streptomyces sp. TRM 70351 TaxID=3116552 RepID=UPI002E7C3129|nr:cupin domain-containing protein [Streptomyces sp. TRM 70351]MEE1928832.1 cupin domain-containing protein [Streptomyces sp. TRM 70351]